VEELGHGLDLFDLAMEHFSASKIGGTIDPWGAGLEWPLGRFAKVGNNNSPTIHGTRNPLEEQIRVQVLCPRFAFRQGLCIQQVQDDHVKQEVLLLGSFLANIVANVDIEPLDKVFSVQLDTLIVKTRRGTETSAVAVAGKVLTRRLDNIGVKLHHNDLFDARPLE
jgi:hypothetical protein